MRKDHFTCRDMTFKEMKQVANSRDCGDLILLPEHADFSVRSLCSSGITTRHILIKAATHPNVVKWVLPG